MAIVHIRIGGREYDVACDDGQEEQLRFLADEVDDRVRSLLFSMGGSPNEALALLLTSLTMADELIENKKEIDSLTGEIERLATLADQNIVSQPSGVAETRMDEIEEAMAITLEEIAQRIEKIADQVEIR